MNGKSCTACGVSLPDGARFCEQCGTPVEREGSSGPVLTEKIPDYLPEAGKAGVTGLRPKLLVAAVFLVLVAAAGILALLSLPENQIPQLGSPLPIQETTIPVTAQSQTPVLTEVPRTTVLTPVTTTREPDPFPGALMLRERFPFGSGKVASQATVYRYWINKTYEWHNDLDNRYYIQEPAPGTKYLFVFIHLENIADTRVWFPSSASVAVHYDGRVYREDRNHFKPDIVHDPKATPVEINEVQYFQKMDGVEYVEDFGFSHGTELAYLYPGSSNAVDGYVIYEVPESLNPEKTYVEIPFNGQDRGIWRLAER